MNAPMEHAIALGADVVPFTLRRSDRRTLGITVFPDGTLVVVAPRDATLETIESRLRRRGGWILRNRREFESFRPRSVPRRYVPGETHRYLGRQLRLTVRPGARRGVVTEGPFLVVGGVPTDDGDSIRRLVQRWYHGRAREIFSERCLYCIRQHFPERSCSPTLTVRQLTQRWGSMSRDGQRMVLNTRLVEASRPLIDYVIVHELCHVTIPDHGPAFFELLENKLPDWQRRKERLERMLA